jgi:SAM-dependent methyltransferase
MPDAVFANERLAAIYDPLDPDRRDLDAYLAMAAEFGVRSVLDVGCGTGTFACLLAARGIEVTGVDPAAASLDVARRKAGADKVRWILGDATKLPPLQADLATMTGNVAQVFTTDEDWDLTLQAIGAALRPGGRLVFETRDPARQAWRRWNRDETWRRVQIAGVGPVEHWIDVLDVWDQEGHFVKFVMTYGFDDGAVLTSESTLRFRRRDELDSSLRRAGFMVDEVRDAPDRAGLEWVYVARH